MLISLLAEALAVTANNLDTTASFLVFAQEASEELSPDTQQKLNLLQFALSILDYSPTRETPTATAPQKTDCFLGKLSNSFLSRAFEDFFKSS